MDSCHICERIDIRDQGEALPWDNVYRTEHWDLVHSYNSSLLGWLVLVARRHVESTHELKAAEAQELGVLIPVISKALQAELNCSKIYQMQFSEQPGHEHIHMHFVPRAKEIPADRKGALVFGYLGADERSRVSDALMNDFSTKLAARMADLV